MWFYLFLFWLNLTGPAAASCFPSEASLDKKVRAADVIFIGVVKSDEEVDNPTDFDHEAIVLVKKVFKGSVPERVIVQYLMRRNGSCDLRQLGSLSVEMGKEKLFFAKKRNDVFFSSEELSVRFVSDNAVREEIEKLPAAVEKASRPWWDFWGWIR